MPATVKLTKRSTMQEVLEAYTRLRGTRFWGPTLSAFARPYRTPPAAMNDELRHHRDTFHLIGDALHVGDLERAIDFYSNHGRRGLDKASYFQPYGFPRACVPARIPFK